MRGAVEAGTWFCVPLLTGGFGVGLAVVTDGLHDLAVFFPHRYAAVPGLADMSVWTPHDVVVAWSIADAAVGHQWPELGVLPGWDAAPWRAAPQVSPLLASWRNSIMGSGLVVMRLDEVVRPVLLPVVGSDVTATPAQPLVIREGSKAGEFCLDFLMTETPHPGLMERGGLPETWETWRALLGVHAGTALRQVEVREHPGRVELVGDGESVQRLQWALLYMWWSRSMFLDAVSTARATGQLPTQ